jgi:CheY-like chemotaxis protein
MSHEMRTPMNAIIGMANIGKNSTNIKQKDYAFEKIFNASSHLLGVVNDVLDMAKIEANKIELFTTSFNFKLMLKRVVNIVDFLATEKKQELLVNVDPNIPRMVAADEQRLVQVITNLLSNAIKFTPEKGKITLDAKMLTTRADGFDIQISVTDTGIGISKENMRRVFVPFEQADDSTVRSYRGTGLGLAICKSIVSLMGGSIYVNSTVGKGSSFTATVQLGFAQKSNGENKAGTNEAPAAILSKEINILLVEDIEINREIILMQFEESAMRFECALNGKQAVQIFAANPSKYDLILMDIQMTELHGLDATRQIRALNAANAKTIPILALTANVFSDDIAACLEAGMNDHIGKPIDYNIMLEKMHAALQEK